MAALAGHAYLFGGWVLIGALGCQSKISECNKLAEIVNQGVARITTVENQASEDPAEYAKDAKHVAELAEQTAAAIGALKIETSELKPRAETYQAVAKDMAEVSRNFADLMQRAEAVKGEQLAAADARFSRTQTALEELCGAGDDDCTKLAAVLDKQPDQPKESELTGVLANYTKDLGALDISSDGLHKAVDDHVAAAEAYALVLHEWNALQAEMAAAEAKLDTIVAREDAIVLDLNAYCVGS